MDRLNPTPAGFRGDPDVIARVEALRPEVEAASAEIERSRRLLPALLDKLHEARLFRLLLPRSVNGVETDPITFFHVIETIARADGSTAWCLSQAGGCATAAAYLDRSVAEEIFGKDPRALLAWGPGPKVKAIEADGGYRVTGAWSFASGGRHATWVGAHCPIHRADGTPLMGPDDRQVERTMLVPSSDVVWTDIWDTIGLRGTASDQFALNDHFVRADHSITRNFEKECRESGPLYRMASLHFYQIGFAGVALGIARASLDAFVDLASPKVLRGFKSPLRDSAVVQTNLARAEVSIRAARAYLLQTVSEIWNSLSQPGGKLTLDQRMMLRMASSYAIHQARDAVDFAYNAAGTAVVFGSHPLERRFHDMHTVTQQLQGRLSHFETVGAWIMGAEVDLTFV
jgi:alkylation response protein AidB-like acyl-CoA dehydrogenase